MAPIFYQIILSTGFAIDICISIRAHHMSVIWQTGIFHSLYPCKTLVGTYINVAIFILYMLCVCVCVCGFIRFSVQCLPIRILSEADRNIQYQKLIFNLLNLFIFLFLFPSWNLLLSACVCYIVVLLSYNVFV